MPSMSSVNSRGLDFQQAARIAMLPRLSVPASTRLPATPPVRFGAYPFGIGGQLAERFHAVVSFDRRPVFKYAPARRGDRVVESFVERRILPADHHRVQESRRFQSAHEPDRFVLLRRAHVPQRSAVRVVVPFVQVDLPSRDSRIRPDTGVRLRHLPVSVGE